MPLRTGARGVVFGAAPRASGYTPRQETAGGVYNVVWLDLSDPQSMTVNTDGTGGNPTNGGSVGRVYNKADPAYVGGATPSGSYFVAFSVRATWNEAGGYIENTSGNDQGSYNAVGSYILGMTSSNSVGYTQAATASLSDVNTNITFTDIRDNSGSFTASIGAFGGDWRLSSNTNGIDYRPTASGSNNAIRAHVTTLDKSGPSGKWYRDGSYLGEDNTGTTTADAAGNATNYNIISNAATPVTIRLYQLVVVPRVVPDLTNLTAFLKAKGGIP
jgi:hypothetical protein